MKEFCFIIAIVLWCCSCKNSNSSRINTLRDTTITPTNSFSELFLDSAKLEDFIAERKLGDSAANRMRNFYNSRNYNFAWFTKEGLAEQALAFWNLHNNYIQLSNDSSFINKRLHEQMALLINEDSRVKITSNEISKTELQLTEHFFEYAQYAYAGKINPEELQWHILRKKVNAMALLDSLIATQGQNIEEWEPVNRQYNLMKNELKRYNDIKKSGTWQVISLGNKKTYKQGDSAIAVKYIKQRLASTGDYNANDTLQTFTNDLLVAVKRAQKRFGLNENGIIDETLIKSLNVPVSTRIEQLLINMERMRWMPKEPEANRIIVNIPEFKLHVIENGKKAFDMNIVVGTAANSTVIFNDVLKYVVFSPYWNIPRSIVRNEIFPAMQRNRNYLSARNMEQTGFSNGLPVIRQKPGGSNALGLVKFIFPNSYNIYFHDTPSKSLFNRDKRAFSHGCIRLAEPKKMAEYLLRNQTEWTLGKIKEAMHASKEKWVTLKEPVPVFISYLTTWVSSDGLLNFREDVYGHDKKMAERLFEQVKVN